MKALLFILISIYSSICVSQEKNISVIYGKKINNINYSKIKDQNVLHRLKSASKSIENIEYELIANKDEAYFGYVEQMQNDGIKTNSRAVTSGGLGGEFYANKPNQERLQYLQVFSENFQISDSYQKYEWQITNEQKTINNYSCYKAKTTINVDDFRGKYSYQIFAWYSPELPYSFGPASYFGNLPGLVLEVNFGKKITVFAKKITLNSTKKIKKLKKGKLVSRKEFENIMTDIFKKINNGQL